MSQNNCVKMDCYFGVEIIEGRLKELTWGAKQLDLPQTPVMTPAAMAKCRLGVVDNEYDHDTECTRQLAVLLQFVQKEIEEPGNPLHFEVLLDADKPEPWTVSLKGVHSHDLIGSKFLVFMLPDED